VLYDHVGAAFYLQGKRNTGGNRLFVAIVQRIQSNVDRPSRRAHNAEALERLAILEVRDELYRGGSRPQIEHAG
jgi:CTP-dependent riboflavin kinase